MPRPSNPAANIRQGLWLGLLGFAIFALNVLTVGFGLAVMAVGFAGRKMPVDTIRSNSLDPEGTAP